MPYDIFVLMTVATNNQLNNSLNWKIKKAAPDMRPCWYFPSFFLNMLPTKPNPVSIWLRIMQVFTAIASHPLPIVSHNHNPFRLVNYWSADFAL